MKESLRQFSLRYLIADAAPLSRRERWSSALAGFLGMLLMQAVLTVVPAGPGLSYLLAPLGASAVILFALPHSPLAQPWSLIGGLLISAIIGALCGAWIQPAFLAVAVALGLAIWVTALLRCIHPPGGAMAVVFALAAQQHPVSLLTAGLNVLAALVAVLVINNLLPGRRYPQCIPAASSPKKAHPPRSSIRHEDLQHALEKLDTYLDVSEDDLVASTTWQRPTPISGTINAAVPTS
jgi:CBS domain-containing membrane protein